MVHALEGRGLAGRTAFHADEDGGNVLLDHVRIVAVIIVVVRVAVAVVVLVVLVSIWVADSLSEAFLFTIGIVVTVSTRTGISVFVAAVAAGAFWFVDIVFVLLLLVNGRLARKDGEARSFQLHRLSDLSVVSIPVVRFTARRNRPAHYHRTIAIVCFIYVSWHRRL